MFAFHVFHQVSKTRLLQRSQMSRQVLSTCYCFEDDGFTITRTKDDFRLHFKGGIYNKLFTATLTDDAKAGDVVVVYKHLFPHEPKMYCRPEAMFEGTVEVDGKVQPRFEKK